jgi:hypothetical protein
VTWSCKITILFILKSNIWNWHRRRASYQTALASKHSCVLMVTTTVISAIIVFAFIHEFRIKRSVAKFDSDLDQLRFNWKYFNGNRIQISTLLYFAFKLKRFNQRKEVDVELETHPNCEAYSNSISKLLRALIHRAKFLYLSRTPNHLYQREYRESSN